MLGAKCQELALRVSSSAATALGKDHLYALSLHPSGAADPTVASMSPTTMAAAAATARAGDLSSVVIKQPRTFTDIQSVIYTKKTS